MKAPILFNRDFARLEDFLAEESERPYASGPALAQQSRGLPGVSPSEVQVALGPFWSPASKQGRGLLSRLSCLSCWGEDRGRGWTRLASPAGVARAAFRTEGLPRPRLGAKATSPHAASREAGPEGVGWPGPLKRNLGGEKTQSHKLFPWLEGAGVSGSPAPASLRALPCVLSVSTHGARLGAISRAPSAGLPAAGRAHCPWAVGLTRQLPLGVAPGPAPGSLATRGPRSGARGTWLPHRPVSLVTTLLLSVVR